MERPEAPRSVEELQQQIKVGLDQLARAEYTEYTSPEELVEDIVTRGEERLATS